MVPRGCALPAGLAHHQFRRLSLRHVADSPTRPAVPLPVAGRLSVERLRRRRAIPPRRVLIGLRAGRHLRRHARLPVRVTRLPGLADAVVWPLGRRLIILPAPLSLSHGRQSPSVHWDEIEQRRGRGPEAGAVAVRRRVPRAAVLRCSCTEPRSGRRRSSPHGNLSVRFGPPMDAMHSLCFNPRPIAIAPIEPAHTACGCTPIIRCRLPTRHEPAPPSDPDPAPSPAPAGRSGASAWAWASAGTRQSVETRASVARMVIRSSLFGASAINCCYPAFISF